MKIKKGTQRTCKNGHQYFKSSDCPVCPLCEKEKKPQADFLNTISAPARRALESQGIVTLIKLSKWSEAEILKLHGIGPSTIPRLKEVLKSKGLHFKS